MNDFLANPDFDQNRFRSDMTLTPARKSYIVYFTPRSGSSWLTEILKSSNRLGNPEEWFNPSFVPEVCRVINANTLSGYIEILKRKQAHGGVFGSEITFYQMEALFGGMDRFLEYFSTDTQSFFLIREDIILQAVSLAKSVATAVYHSAQSAAEDIEKADRSFEYDPEKIGHWLRHILDQERRTEAAIGSSGVTPTRLSYERMTASGPRQVLKTFFMALGEDVVFDAHVKSSHIKIGTDRNIDFAERFRKENAALVREVETARRSTISDLGEK